MFIEMPKRISPSCVLHCFSCKTRRATHACTIGWEGTIVKACLCPKCQMLETSEIVENVLGPKNHNTDQTSRWEWFGQTLDAPGNDAWPWA